MNNCYDVIVVGAGNAGLSTAATTAMNGLKTLVLERNLVPGGCATSFCRGRFEFEASLHELCNIGTEENPGSIRKLLDSYGAEVNWHSEDTLYRVIADGEDGYDVIMPAGVKNFIREIENQVPGCKESVTTMFQYIKKIGEAIAYLSSGKVDQNVLVSEHTDFLRMASHSVDDCLRAFKIPEKACQIIKTYWPYLGASTSELDFVHYAILMERYTSGKPSFPSKTSHEISLALEKAIRSLGGEIWYNAEVTDVLIKDGKAYGVKVGNQSLFAKHIVLNCWPDTAYSYLMNENDIPERALKLSNARKCSSLFFTVYLGLDKSYEELGINDYSVFMYNTTDTLEQYNGCETPGDGILIANCLNKVVSNASPNGTCTLFLTTLLSEEAWGDVAPQDYKKRKNQIANKMIERYEKTLGINIRPHIEEIVIAAPPTFARYLSTPNGTPYGYMIQPWDTIIFRMMNRRADKVLDGITFVGAHAENSDGYSTTFSNGNSAGKRIVKEIKQNG